VASDHAYSWNWGKSSRHRFDGGVAMMEAARGVNIFGDHLRRTSVIARGYTENMVCHVVFNG